MQIRRGRADTSCGGNRRASPEVHCAAGAGLRALLVAVVAVLLTAAPGAAPPELVPVDEASMQPAFFSFRAQLLRNIARRDLPALLEVVDPNIKNSFGGDDGVGKFRELWKLDSGASELWSELGTVLGLGGAFHDDNTFVAPYTFARFPEGLDAFDHLVVIGSDVRLRAAPRAAATVVGASSFGILRVAPSAGDSAEWAGVRLDNGRTAYVASHLVRSPVDYRAIFSRTGGGWRMVTFVAGD